MRITSYFTLLLVVVTYAIGQADEFVEVSSENFDLAEAATYHDVSAAACDCGSCVPWSLFGTAPNGLTINGWVDQGFTHNHHNPANPPHGFGNLPVGYNYRSDEYQLNQLYLSAERAADNGGYGLAVGGRVDLMFGEDYIFVRSTGLETDDRGRVLPGSNHWNAGAGGGGIAGNARNGLALPQAYGEVAYNNLNMKIGHFYSGMTYESAMSPENFFYSHSYNFQYGMPVTLTGAMAEYQFSDRLTLFSGLHNGWDVFDGPSDQIGLMGGARWQSYDGGTSLQFMAITGEDALAPTGVVPMPAGRDTLTAYSVILTHRITCRLQYVLEHVNGWQDRGSFEPGRIGIQDAEWYSINQYLFYTLNDTWKAGVRSELMNSDDGARVASFGGKYRALSVGLNYTPCCNVVIRPELRWDNFNPHDPATPPGPFSSFSRGNQFLTAIDAIVLF